MWLIVFHLFHILNKKKKYIYFGLWYKKKKKDTEGYLNRYHKKDIWTGTITKVLFFVIHHRCLYFSAPSPSPDHWAWPLICVYWPWLQICIYQPWLPMCVYRPWPKKIHLPALVPKLYSPTVAPAMAPDLYLPVQVKILLLLLHSC